MDTQRWTETFQALICVLALAGSILGCWLDLGGRICKTCWTLFNGPDWKPDNYCERTYCQACRVGQELGRED